MSRTILIIPLRVQICPLKCFIISFVRLRSLGCRTISARLTHSAYFSSLASIRISPSPLVHYSKTVSAMASAFSRADFIPVSTVRS